MGQKRRGFRVAEKLQVIIAMELNRTSDPRFSLVTVSRAEMTPDLRQAKVYWMVHGSEDRKEEVTEAFKDRLGAFRKVVASELGTRLVPQIAFLYDDTFDVADRMEELFQRIRK